MADAHQTGGSTSLQTTKVWDSLTWEAEDVTGIHGLQKQLFFSFPEFVHKGLLHKIPVLVKIFWATNSQKSMVGKYHYTFTLGRQGYLSLAAVGDSAGSAWPFLSMNRGCFHISRNHRQSTWSLLPKGPQHLLRFHQGQSYELDLVLQQPKVRLLPTTITSIRPITWVPNSTQTSLWVLRF